MSLNSIVASPKDWDPEPYFSWQPCENCGDPFGGNRYDIIYRETLDGEILEASVCEECYMRLCG